MKHRVKKILICFFFIFSFPAFSQVDSSGIIEDDIIDNLLGESAEESDNSELINIIESLTQNPIDLNSATIDELQKIPYIDFAAAQNIIKRRETSGRFDSKGELFLVNGLSATTTQKVLPMVFVKDEKDNLKKIDRKGLFTNLFSDSRLKIRSRTSKSLQPQDGFTDGAFAGSQLKVYNRIIWNFSDIQAGILTEKDAGEKPIDEFTSAHLYLRNFLFFDQVIVGDFNLQFGQGLAMWSPYGFSKGQDAIFPAKKEGNKIKPYTSTDENKFFRGIAFGTGFKSFKISGFLSKNYFDASIDSVSNGIISTPVDGYHRTVKEICKSKSAFETSFGIDFSISILKEINLGFLAYHSSFNKSFLPASIYERSGSSFNYFSFYYDLYIPGINLFGESAYNGTSAASLNSLQYSNGKDFAFLVSVRSYPMNYINLHGLGFGEHSKDLNNEFGIYTGVKWITPAGLINFYFDQFRFPAASYQEPLPSNGNEIAAGLTSKPFISVETKLLLKYQDNETCTEINNRIQTARKIRQNLRFEVNKSLNPRINIKGRFEFNNIDIEGSGIEKGFLFYQELKIQPSRVIVLLGRMIFYKTDSFNSAVYEYESGFPGMLSNLALYGEGLRWYLILKYKFLPSIEILFKYSETIKPKEKTIGSGYNEINGNLDNSFYLQLDVDL